MTTEAIEFTDRYQALGIPYPDVTTMCKGGCEGTGYVPVHVQQRDNQLGVRLHSDELMALWREAHRKVPLWKRVLWALRITKFDGWHFVLCPRCKGSRLEP